MRLRTIRQRVEDSSYDLNLAPMLDMMVALVPFLLLSIAFVRLVVVETKVPQPVAKAIQEDRDKKDREVNIHMKIDIKKGVSLLIKQKGSKTKTINVALKEGSFDVDSVHKELHGLKEKYPDVFRIEVLPSESVSYRDIVALMDTARYATKDDRPLFILDNETNKKVQTNLMFRDVIFGNVVGS